MAYPTYRQDFEGGSTLATACPELIDRDAAFAIDTTTAHAWTGNNSLKQTAASGNHDLCSNVVDSLGGNVTISYYFKPGQFQDSQNIYARITPAGLPLNNWIRAEWSGTTGLQIRENVATVLNILTTAGGSASFSPGGQWICFEFRCQGAALSTRMVRQSDGFYFDNPSGTFLSTTPKTVSGTTTLPVTAGSWGLRVGDASGINVDNLIYGPGTPSIDLPVVTITPTGNQQLTAGGFTDPLFGVTWGSSDPTVATVGATTGLVTAVAVGICTITATGKRDTSQTATSSVTITGTAVTVITSTPPAPASGYAHNPSAAITYTLGNGSLVTPLTVTPVVVIGVTGTFSPTTLTLTNAIRSGTVMFMPSAVGSSSIGCTNDGSLTNPLTFVYTSIVQGFSIAPNSFMVGTPITASFIGAGTLWSTSAPTFTTTGIACTVGTPTVTSGTACTALITPGANQGSVTFTDSTTSATSLGTIGPFVATTSYLSSVSGFAQGLIGTVGYTVINSQGGTQAARSTAGVFIVGTAGYAVVVTVPTAGSGPSSGQFLILWDDGSGHQAFDETPLQFSPAVFFTSQMTESYAADGAAPTLAQALLAIQQRLNDFGIVGQALTVRKLDGTTPAFQLTLNSATAPTDSTRTS